MASERRSYTKIPNAVITAGLSDSALATLVRLQLYLADRWRLGRLPAAEAGSAVLSPQAMMLVANRTTVKRAAAVLARLADDTRASRLTIRRCPAGVQIDWPAFVEYQGFIDKELPQVAPNSAPSASASASDPKSRMQDAQTSSPNSHSEVAAGSRRLAAVVAAAPPPTQHTTMEGSEREFRRGKELGLWNTLREYHESVKARRERAREAVEV